MHLSFILLGLCYAVGQAVLVREFLSVFYGNEVFIGVIFASWFFWIGCGSLLCARLADRVKDPPTVFGFLQLLLPLSLIAQVAGIRFVRQLINIPAAEILPLGISLVSVAIITMPCSLLIGILFPLGCRIAGEADRETARPVSRVYLFETIGSIAGGILFSLVLAGRAGHITIVLGLVCVVGINAGLYLRRQSRVAGTAASLAPLVIGCLAGLSVLISPVRTGLEGIFDRMRWRSIQSGLELVASADTPYQNVSIGKRGGQYSLLGDGKFISSFPEEEDHARRAAILLAQRPDARDILVIGGGIDGLLCSLLAYPVEHIDLVIQDRVAYKLVAAYLPEKDRTALEDKRVKIHFADGRRFLQTAGVKKTYDIIISLFPDPSSAAVNRFYTLEFYRDAARVLTPKGILCADVQSAENYLGINVADYAGSIYKTMATVFPEVVIAPGERLLFCAALTIGVVTADHRVLEQRYRSVMGTAAPFPAEAFKSIYQPERISFALEKLKRSTAGINTDEKPVTYYFNMLLWSNFSGSEWVRIFERIRSAGAVIYVLPFLIICLMRLLYVRTYPDMKREMRYNAQAAICATGFSSMALQVILMLQYQARFGFIYERIGMVTAFFMLGLAGGAFGMMRRQMKASGQGLIIASLLVLFGIYAVLLPRCMAGSPEMIFFLLFFVSGVITGSLFPLGAELYFSSVTAHGETGGFLDAADHAGAACGALLSGTCMVPLVGIRYSCAILGGVLVLAALPVFFSCLGNNGDQTDRPAPPVFVRMIWIVATAGLIIGSIVAWDRFKGFQPDRHFNSSFFSDNTGSDTFTYRKRPFPHFAGFDPHGKQDTITVRSEDVIGEVWGYGGPMNLLISLSMDGTVKKVSVIEWRETDEYVRGMDGWLEQFNGRNVAKDLPVKRSDLDALSRATVTIDAVISIVNHSLSRVRLEILGIPLPARQAAEEMPREKIQRIPPKDERSIDRERFRRASEVGELSSREAIFYHRIGEEQR